LWIIDFRDPRFLDRLKQFSRKALATGALRSLDTQTFLHKEGEALFLIRQKTPHSDSSPLEEKKRTYPPPSSPFLPPEENLFLDYLDDKYMLVLNKFNVCPGHLLLITRDFAPQNSLLKEEDFTPALKTLEGPRGLVFFNSGPKAGASQEHRHLQWIPLPMTREYTQDPLLFFTHHIAPVIHSRVIAYSAPPSAAQAARDFKKMHASLEQELALSPLPYNLLFTPQGMALIPRSQAAPWDIQINALGYGGSLFVKSPQERSRLTAMGIINLLKQGSFPR